MKIIIDNKEYNVIGKGVYSSKGNPDGIQIKIFLEGSKSLMIIPQDNIAFLGTDKGEIKEFNNFPPKVNYNGMEMEMTNHDYQIEKKVEFGWTEGECEFWDYEGKDKNMFISVAVLTSSNKRSDVVLKLIDSKKIKGLNSILKK